MFHRHAVLGVILSSTSVLACADSSTTGTWAGSITDSAGITIVLNEASVANVPTWTTEPEVVIGVIDGPDEYVFGEIGDVEVDSRGRLLVLDRQARLARVYGPDGRFLHDVGGPGEGPGELSDDVYRIATGRSDSIYILDFAQLRLNVYGADGSSARTIPLRFGQQGPYDFHLVGDSALLIRWLTYEVDPDGRFVPWDVLLSTDVSGVKIDTLLEFDYPPPDLGGMQELQRPLIVNAAFVDVLADGRIAWSDLEGQQVAIHDPTGKLGLFVRTTDWSRHPTTPEERAALENMYREGSDEPDRPVPDLFGFPDSLPTITALRASPGGGFWVQRFTFAEATARLPVYPVYSVWLGGRTWEVYDADGRLLATVRMPPRFRITRVLDSVVIGVQRDELDIERVMKLRIVR